MKLYVCGLAMMLSGYVASSQEYNVPYKHEGKYVLINQSGKQVLDNTYDDLKWISGAFFMGTTQLKSDEPLVVGSQTYIRGSEGIIQTDLIYNNKVLIANSPFQHFTVNNIGIVSAGCGSLFTVKDKASLDKYQITEDNRIVLFNTHGKLLYKKAVTDFNLMSELTTKGAVTHYLLLVETRPSVFDVCVYDIKMQSITQTILAGTKHTRIYDKDADKGSFTFKYEDATKKTISKAYTFNGKTMVAVTNVASPQPVRKEPANYDDVNSIQVDLFGDDVKASEPKPNEGKEHAKLEPAAPVYHYTIIRDTVYGYFNNFSYDKADVIGVNTNTTTYKLPMYSVGEGIIKCEQGSCEIISHRKRTGLVYKEADYIGHGYYLVKNDAHKYGIINKQLETILPIEYDSIQLNPIRISDGAVGVRIYGRSSYEKPIMKFGGDYTMAFAYKGGKVTVLQYNFKPLLAQSFDGFYKNVAHHSALYLGEKQDYVAVSGNDYFAAGYDEDAKKYATVGPFTGYPLYVYHDYYNIKGLKLYSIYDKDFKFVGYADKSGQIIKLM